MNGGKKETKLFSVGAKLYPLRLMNILILSRVERFCRVKLMRNQWEGDRDDIQADRLSCGETERRHGPKKLLIKPKNQ